MNNPYQPSSTELDQLMRSGALKLERTAGIPTWEALPLLHPTSAKGCAHRAGMNCP
ncbi:MAG: hypothetical protein WCP31_02025 [Chloroflexales bacterium]